MAAILLAIIYSVITLAMIPLKNNTIHVLFLATSNLFVIPSVLETFKRGLWFESTYLFIMSTTSMVYHLTYGFGTDVGLWFREADWLFAMTTAPVFVNCFFFHKKSYYKMVANFWIFTLISSFTDTLMINALIYALPLSVYIITMFSLRRRHFSDMPPKILLLLALWVGIGVSLFFVSDIEFCQGNTMEERMCMYWPLHTIWHVFIFMGIYTILTIGCLDDDEERYKRMSLCNTMNNLMDRDKGILEGKIARIGDLDV